MSTLTTWLDLLGSLLLVVCVALLVADVWPWRVSLSVGVAGAGLIVVSAVTDWFARRGGQR